MTYTDPAPDTDTDTTPGAKLAQPPSSTARTIVGALLGLIFLGGMVGTGLLFGYYFGLVAGIIGFFVAGGAVGALGMALVTVLLHALGFKLD